MLLTKTLIEECRQQIDSLGAMFSDIGLVKLAKKHPQHPAVERHNRLLDLINSGVTYPDELEILREVTASLLDHSVWAQAPQTEDYWSFIPQLQARERVRQGIQDAEKFHDVIAEVFFWSWLKERIQNVELVEEIGLPDIVIGRGGNEEIWAEVKRIRLGKNPKRLAEIISKANDQLKNAQPERSGLVFISIERAIERMALDDRIPNDINPYIKEVERRLGSDFCKSVDRVVISWDDFVVETEPGASITYKFRRRSVTLEHHLPRTRITVAKEITNVERNIQISTGWPNEADDKRSGHGPRASLGNIVVSPSFREFNASRDGIRPNHAIEALTEPDAIYRYQFAFGTGEQLLVTRRVMATRKSYTMLLIVRLLSDGRQEIGEAYRLYDEENYSKQLHMHPMSAFDALIRRYSVPFSIPTQYGKAVVNLIKAARLEVKHANKNPVLQLFDLPPGVAALSGAARFRILNTMPPICEIEWLWFLDEQRYHDDIRKHIR